MLFHTGPRELFTLVAAAVSPIIPLKMLKYAGLSRLEADECGSLNAFLASAPQAVPVCGHIAALVFCMLMQTSTRTLLCGELFTQGGAGEVALTKGRHPWWERGVS